MIEKICKECSTCFKQYNTAQTRCQKCTYNRYAKPKKPIKRMGKVAKKWIEVRHDWIKQNTNSAGTWNCHYCGKHLTIDTLTLDHVIARSKRPDLRYNHDNLVPCCYPCNSKKGSKSA